MFASASDPLFKDLFVNFLSFIHILFCYSFDSLSILILQQEKTKITVLDANLLRNVDPSLSSSESDAFDQGWLVNYWSMDNKRNNKVNQRLLYG